MATRKGTTGRPGPTTVLLVRHGRTSTTGSVLPGRAPGLHLSGEGRAQAEAAAQRIAPLQPGAVYASPMERTRETAAPIARATPRVQRSVRLVPIPMGIRLLLFLCDAACLRVSRTPSPLRPCGAAAPPPPRTGILSLRAFQRPRPVNSYGHPKSSIARTISG